MKVFYFFFSIFYITTLLHADKIDSQPDILFKYDKIQKNQEKFRLQVEFNKAVLLLEKGEYKKAIEMFKTTSEILKIPSFLNIGIAYYKLKQKENALLYLNNIYEYKEAIYTDTYSYISAAYYLYQINDNRDYLNTIINITKKYKNLTEHSKRLVVDTYILLKNYENALNVLKTMQFQDDLKIALLYLKLKNYASAEKFFIQAKEKSFNRNRIDEILWFMVFRDLKSNQLEKLKEHLDEIKDRKDSFKINLSYPLEIFFNRNKYSTKEYLSFITKFSKDRKIDYIYYFAPFIFSDTQEIVYDMSRGFIFKDKQNVQSLEKMVAYNSKFIDIIKDDPIVRVKKLKEYIKEDSTSYIYYNLALCYAQIFDYHNAYKYFSKAYKLNPGNKLYSTMTLITADKIDLKVADFEYIEKNIRSNNGLYKYFGQTLYKIMFNPEFVVNVKGEIYLQTIFYKALDYLIKMEDGTVTAEHPLLLEYYKDPLVYLLDLTLRRKNENDFKYFARLQDNTPLKINNNFLEGPPIITSFYFDLLKAIGLFDRADFSQSGIQSPTYLRTKALVDLHENKPQSTLKILNKLQKKYKLEDKYTMFLIVAAYLSENKYNEASLQISLIEAILKDADADFLTGVQLIQELKLSNVSHYFKKPYMDSIIDFRLKNLDNFLESM
ncbi:MAG: tetratricopeptide repeat protein [Halarcobacter sp.]